MDPKFNRWMIAFTVILLAVVEILDITIVSVALLSMKGALSASPSQITWTITVYVVTAAICMPLVGLLSKQFGRRNLLLFSALGFGFASFLCGLATNLMAMILFRGLQGIFGAFLPALAQSTLLETFPGKEANKAMALFGVGIMLGPILGPILGGIIVDHLGWRWIFFINIPICLLASVLTLKFIKQSKVTTQKIDWVGLGLLALGVGALQYILDNGNALNWFSSNSILIGTTLSVVAVCLFISRGLAQQHNVVNFKFFRDKNFMLSSLAMLLFCGILLGTMSWLPLWLEIFMHYPATTVGVVLIPRGLFCLITMMLSPMLLKWIEGRILIIIASLLYMAGCIMSAHFNLLQGEYSVFWPNTLKGIACGLFFVPITGLAYQSINNRDLDGASGLFNFSRSIGCSIGVAIFSTIVTREAQINWHTLVQHINPFSQNYYHYLAANHLTQSMPDLHARLGVLVSNQANMIAFNDANLFFGFLCLLMIPLVIFIRKPENTMLMAH